MTNTKKLIEQADAIIILAGAGMGVDSGLATFRGDEGMWKAYPALGKRNMSFSSIANPIAFKKYPSLAWAFYGHRFDAYKNTTPHEGFDMLLDLCKTKKDYFVVTSNVDGHFQKAGFDADNIYEVHGRINKFQCTHCWNKTWDAPTDLEFNIVGSASSLKSKIIPKCPHCGSVARPNIMMFGDTKFNSEETDFQNVQFNNFMHKYDKGDKKIVLIEIGSGTAIPTIRMVGENISSNVDGATLIRINPDEFNGADVGISMGALDGIKEILK